MQLSWSNTCANIYTELFPRCTMALYLLPFRVNRTFSKNNAKAYREHVFFKRFNI